MKRIVHSLSLLSILSAPAYSWNYELAPYIWASGLEGTLQTGPHRFHVHETFSELLRELDFGAMLFAAAYKNNFGVFFNGIYTKVSDKLTFDDVWIHTSSVLSIDSAGASYRITFPHNKIMLEPYVGARFL